MVPVRIGSILGHLFYPAEKPEDSRSGVARTCCRYIYYGCALGVLALKPSGICGIRVNIYRCATT